MSEILAWRFVEDNEQEAQSFAQALSAVGDRLEVTPLIPKEARTIFTKSEEAVDGVLMDVDLSAISGEVGTGLGIAQDMRAKQKAGEIRDFPIVRFANVEPIKVNVGGDPTSDDLFDLKIAKSEVRHDSSAVAQKLIGLCDVYKALADSTLADTKELESILGLSSEMIERWSHASFHDRIADGRDHAIHVAAGAFVRTFVQAHGLLIDKYLLSVRLGVDRVASGEQWDRLLNEHCSSFSYKGAGGQYFPRWWSRGLDEWWLEVVGDEEPLAARTIEERCMRLRSYTGLDGLAPLFMPKGSPGSRPWRLCTLSLERDQPDYVPIDPACAVRLTPRTDLPPWVDPTYAELSLALQSNSDKRLSRYDLERLKKQYARE